MLSRDKREKVLIRVEYKFKGKIFGMREILLYCSFLKFKVNRGKKVDEEGIEDEGYRIKCCEVGV